MYKRRLTGYALSQVNELRNKIYNTIVHTMYTFREIDKAN